ncbi:hypothetical protein FRC04_008703 [Tulasnella sp. 424]|nr:hypothetical protein FRC04_008703 [Tulasnella sp. 424]KAG8979935.1 hypothetical protein FRC05_007378 [Tulasnella sp. 425]
MEEGIPSLSSGAVGSRFVSQSEIDAANATRDEQWKAAYARIGQEPPPRPAEDYDGRSLFERLQEQKTLKQEQWDEKMKLSNQFRGIDEEDSAFLAQVQDDSIQQEILKKKQEAQELAAFRAGQAKLAEKAAPTAAASSSAPVAPSAASTKPTKPTKPAATPAPSKSSLGKKDQKSILKGVVIKKKDKERPKAKKQESTDSTKAAEPSSSSGGDGSSHKRKADEQTAPSNPDDGNKKARLATSND